MQPSRAGTQEAGAFILCRQAAGRGLFSRRGGGRLPKKRLWDGVETPGPAALPGLSGRKCGIKLPALLSPFRNQFSDVTWLLNDNRGIGRNEEQEQVSRAPFLWCRALSF